MVEWLLQPAVLPHGHHAEHSEVSECIDRCCMQDPLYAVLCLPASRKNELPLDKMSLVCEVTKKTKEEMTAPPREGAYIHGLFMEGAR